MNFDHIDLYLVFDIFLLLLIGMGPKIALVPFLELTQGMEPELRKQVAHRMVLTGVVTALLLVLFGWFLIRLLHFSSGAADVAGGIVLLILALHMMELLANPRKVEDQDKVTIRDPMHLAAYPLAVPYLLNPVGIASIVIMSDAINSVLIGVIIVALVVFVGALDLAVFHNIDRLAKRLDPTRLAVTEAVFGVLLAALAVQLVVNGLVDMGVLSLTASH